MNFRKYKFGYLGLLLGFGIVLFMIWQIGFEDISRILTQASIIYVLLALALDQLAIGLSAFRWLCLIKSVDNCVRYKTIYLIHLVGLAVNNITPFARLGGEPVKLYLLKKRTELKNSEGLATIIACGFYDLGSFLLLDIIAIFLIYFALSLPLNFAYPLFLFVFVFSALLFLLVYVSINNKVSLSIIRWIFSKLKRVVPLRERLERWETNIETDVKHYVTTLKTTFRSVILNVFTTLGARTLEILRIYMIVLAVGGEIDLIWVVVALAFAVASGMIPSPPGGIGIVEPAMLVAFLLGGLTPSLALAVILIDRLVTLGFTSLIGFGCVHFIGLERDITRLSESVKVVK